MSVSAPSNWHLLFNQSIHVRIEPPLHHKKHLIRPPLLLVDMLRVRQAQYRAGCVVPCVPGEARARALACCICWKNVMVRTCSAMRRSILREGRNAGGQSRWPGRPRSEKSTRLFFSSKKKRTTLKRRGCKFHPAKQVAQALTTRLFLHSQSCPCLPACLSSLRPASESTTNACAAARTRSRFGSLRARCRTDFLRRDTPSIALSHSATPSHLLSAWTSWHSRRPSTTRICSQKTQRLSFRRFLSSR